MSTLASPTWFGPYRLTSRIATGGMAEVYAGRRFDPTTGTAGPMVAVKRLLPHLVSDTTVVRMFLNEARITAQIDHPNVVRILDLGPKPGEEGEPYIVMELLEGKSFAEVRQRAAGEGKRVPLGITLRILTEACRGLDAAHRAVDEQGRFLCIVHRDFTPDNIHVGVNGDVKVIDFGIAKAEQWGSGTEPGTLKGKFFYMSPEMIAGGAVDHRADLFAAGVMLYEQLCGRRPFTGNSVDEVVQRIAEGNPKRPTEFDPSVPPALEAICLMALHRNPDKRFPSLQEFISAIESVGGAAQVATREELGGYVSELFPAEKDPKRQTLKRARQFDPSVPGRSPVPPAAPRVRAKLVAAAAAVTLLALSGAAAFWKLSPDLSPPQRLAAAKATSDAADRVRLLTPLGADADATADQLEQAGSLLLSSAQYGPALELAEKWKARFPNDVRALHLEARAAMRQRMGKRAESAIAAAAKLAPDDAVPDLLLADLRELQGDAFGALDALTVAAKKRPGSAEVAGRRGYFLSQTGRLDEAAEALQQSLSRRYDGRLQAELAFVRFRQGQNDEAKKLLERALKKEPQLSVAHYYLGAVLYRQGDVRGAERAYRTADRLDPTDPRALAALCQLQAQSKSRDVAETQKRIASRFPEQSQALLAQCAP